MELKELDRLKKYSTEDDLIKVVQEIDDKVIFRGYSIEQVISLAEVLVNIDLLSVKYEAREEILHLLCDIISYHGKSVGENGRRLLILRMSWRMI